jgi:hypothetical protein
MLEKLSKKRFNNGLNRMETEKPKQQIEPKRRIRINVYLGVFGAYRVERLKLAFGLTSKAAVIRRALERLEDDIPPE